MYMFDEVIIALTQKFNIEGMKAKVEPLNDSRAEWIYFKNKKEILYFKYPEITESGPKFQYFIYEVYRRNDTKTEITVYEDRVFIRTYKGYEVEIKTDGSVDLRNKSPKQIFLVTKRFPKIDAESYDGIKIFRKIIEDLDIQENWVSDARIQRAIEIESGKITKLCKRERHRELMFKFNRFSYKEKAYEFNEELNGTFTLVLHGTQEDIEVMVTKELMEKAKRRIRNFRQKIEQFNSD